MRHEPNRRRPRVFIVNATDNDLSPSLAFGDPYYVNQRYIYGDEIKLEDDTIPDSFRRNMRAAADLFDPDRDYLLIVGDHLQLVVFSAMLSARYHYFNVLRYDRIRRSYFLVRVDGFRPVAVGEVA